MFPPPGAPWPEPDLEPARLAAEAALAASPGDRAARITLARVAAAAGDFSAANRHLALASLVGGEDVDSLLVQAVVAAQTRDDPEVAIGLYQRALAQARSPRADAHFGLGAVLVSVARYHAALSHLREAGRLAPDAGPIQYQLARALLGAGAPADALPHLARALLLSPGNVAAWETCTSLLLEHGLAPEAEGVLRTALASLGPSAPLQGQLVRALVAQGKGAEALELSSALAAASPGGADLENLHLQALAAAGRLDEAVSLAETLQVRRRASVATLLWLGSIYEGRGEVDAALVAYGHAAQVDPRDWRGLNELGHLLLRRPGGEEARNVQAAAEAFEAALFRAPLEVAPRLNLALARARQGRTEEARRAASLVTERAASRQSGLKEQAERLLKVLGNAPHRQG